MTKRAIIVAAMVVTALLCAAFLTTRHESRPGQPSPHAIDQNQ